MRRSWKPPALLTRVSTVHGLGGSKNVQLESPQSLAVLSARPSRGGKTVHNQRTHACSENTGSLAKNCQQPKVISG